MDKLTIACVLKTGGDYGPRHVMALAAGLRKHFKKRYRFVCLADTHVKECERIPLIHKWPGWWSKIELFRPGLFQGPVLYMDLDTVITGDISELAAGPHKFTMLHSFSTPKNAGSGVMAWTGDLSKIYGAFKEAPQKWMDACQTHEMWGDQGFIFKHAPAPDYWQDRFPGQIVSYKKNCVDNGGKAPAGARIVCYHGKPRPWEAPLR